MNVIEVLWIKKWRPPNNYFWCSCQQPPPPPSPASNQNLLQNITHNITGSRTCPLDFPSKSLGLSTENINPCHHPCRTLFQPAKRLRKYQIQWLRLSLKRLRKWSQFSQLPLRLSEEPKVRLQLVPRNKRKLARNKRKLARNKREIAVNLKSTYQKFPILPRESSRFASQKEKQKSTPQKAKPQNKQPAFRLTDNALIDSLALPYHLLLIP